MSSNRCILPDEMYHQQTIMSSTRCSLPDDLYHQSTIMSITRCSLPDNLYYQPNIMSSNRCSLPDESYHYLVIYQMRYFSASNYLSHVINPQKVELVKQRYVKVEGLLKTNEGVVENYSLLEPFAKISKYYWM